MALPKVLDDHPRGRRWHSLRPVTHAHDRPRLRPWLGSYTSRHPGHDHTAGSRHARVAALPPSRRPSSRYLGGGAEHERSNRKTRRYKRLRVLDRCRVRRRQSRHIRDAGRVRHRREPEQFSLPVPRPANMWMPVRSPCNTEVAMAWSGKFVIKHGRGGKTHFVLLASNGRVVATSETYESKESCLKGIDAEAPRRRRSGDRRACEGATCQEGRAHEEVDRSAGDQDRVPSTPSQREPHTDWVEWLRQRLAAVTCSF